MLQTYISILRGINVSGHKVIKMNDLSKLYETLGFKHVQTYIQSGNVVFQADETEKQLLEKSIAAKILEAFGFDVPVLVKTLPELLHVLKSNPFLNTRNETTKALHVTFLSQTPEQTHIDKIKEGPYAADEFVISSNSVYLFCPNGYGNTKLTNNFFENKLKVAATTRNWNTLLLLATIANKSSNSINHEAETKLSCGQINHF